MRANLINGYNEGGISERPAHRYLLMGTNLMLLSTPAETTTLELWYWKRPTDITAIGSTPDLPTHMHEVLLECVLWEYLDRTYGDKDPALYGPKLARQQAKYLSMLAQALTEDRTRSNPVLQFQRVMF